MGGLLWNIGAFIVALGLLVAVHEFGHFWVARRCGVKVERFSIGFGKAIWRRLGKDGTEYVLALIPLGGYVKMLDGRVDELKPGEEAQAFNHKSVWARMAIVAAGPMANFVFALFAFWLMFMIGVPSVKPVVGEVRPASIVERFGLKNPIFEATASYGHFGNRPYRREVTLFDHGREVTKEIEFFGWEKLDEVENLRREFGIL